MYMSLYVYILNIIKYMYIYIHIYIYIDILTMDNRDLTHVGHKGPICAKKSSADSRRRPQAATGQHDNYGT